MSKQWLLEGKNSLIEALSFTDRRRLLAKTTRVVMETKSKIYEKNKQIRQIYFPLSGVYSIVGDTNDGRTAEVATVGKEGMLGLPIFLRTDTIPLRAFTQIPGETLQMEVRDFQSLTADREGPLARILYRYIQGLLNQIAQHAACTAVHPVQTRCARWLLMSHDRMGADEFPLTHEFLAQMLGVRRASVSGEVSKLQRAGLITYRRGVITICDRKGLESVACEHYALTRDEYERLLSIR